MKKSAVCFLFVLILTLSGALAAVFVLHDDRDHVAITAEVLSGDPAAAEGLTARWFATYNSLLHWDMRLPAAHPEEAVTAFEMEDHFDLRDPQDLDFYPRLPSGLSFSYGGNSSTTLTDARSDSPEIRPYYDLYEAVYAETPSGGTLTKDLPLGDYMDTYPLALDAYGSQVAIGQALHPMDPWSDHKEVNALIQDFFAFPLLPEETCTVSITKTADGALEELRSHTHQMEDLFPVSAYHGEDLYFTFLPTNLSFENTPGGFGLYHIAVTPEEADGDGNWTKPILHLDTLTNALPLPAEAAVRTLDFTPDGAALLLTYYLGEDCFLEVLDPETLASRQTLPVPTPAPAAGEEGGLDYPLHEAKAGENFLLLRDNRDLYVFSLEEGLYTYAYRTQPEDEMALRFYAQNYAWNGEKLALITQRNLYEETTTDYTGFYLAVMDETGVLYKALYGTSLPKVAEKAVDDLYFLNAYHCCEARTELTWN